MESNVESHHWSQVVNLFRQACILHREGKVPESRQIVEHDLRRGISDWTKSCVQTPTAKRARLETMFKEEQRRVDDAWMVQSLVVRQLSQQIIPALSNRLAAEIRDSMRSHEVREFTPVPVTAEPFTIVPETRVPFDDVAGMIDLLTSASSRSERLENHLVAA